MCEFYTSLPKHSKSAGMNSKPKNLVLTMKPCADENTYYRFRLLAFSGINTDRDDPHICRFVHQIWGKHPEKGYPVVEDEIVCPVSPHVHVENKYHACKVCETVGKYWDAYKNSNKTDKDALKKARTFSRKYQAIIPVYVVNDPNYDGNNGKFKVIVINDKKVYTDFRAKIEKASLAQTVFNGKNAVDCCIHVSDTAKVVNEGQPNEYVYHVKEIDKVKFSTKPYDIPSITRETVDAMEFDKTYYTSSSPAEIDAFYKKHCIVSNDDIPDDDEIKVFDSKPATTVEVKPAPVVQNVEIKKTPVEVPVNDISTDEVDALLEDPDNSGLDAGIAKPVEDAVPATNSQQPAQDIDADDLLAGLDL